MSGSLPSSGAAITVTAYDASGNPLTQLTSAAPIPLSNHGTTTIAGNDLAARFQGTPMTYQFAVPSSQYIFTNVKGSNSGTISVPIVFTSGTTNYATNSVRPLSTIKITDMSGSLSSLGAAITVSAWDANGNALTQSGSAAPLTLPNHGTTTITGSALAARFPAGTPAAYQFAVASSQYIITNVTSSTDGSINIPTVFTSGTNNFNTNSVDPGDTIKVSDLSGSLSSSGAVITVSAWDVNGNALTQSGSAPTLTLPNYGTTTITGTALAARFQGIPAAAYSFSVASLNYLITTVKSTAGGTLHIPNVVYTSGQVSAIETATQKITAASGGTIALSGGSTVTIPAGAFTSDREVTLSLVTGLSQQPPSGFIVGVGDALVLSTLASPFSTSTGNINFVISTGANTTGLQRSAGLADLIDSTGHNFFGVAGSLDTSTNLASITVPALLMSGTNSVVVSMCNLSPFYASQRAAAMRMTGSLLPYAKANVVPPSPGQLSWNGSAWVPYSGCPANSSAKVLVLVHGMNSSVEEAYGNNGQNVTVNGTNDYCVNQIQKAAGENSSGQPTYYSQVVGFDYDWKNYIENSGLSFANFLNTLAACGNKIDVEAHSEGGLVAAYGITQASTTTKNLISNFIGLGNPWTGTLAASGAVTLGGFIPYSTVSMGSIGFYAGAIAEYVPLPILHGITLQDFLNAQSLPEMQPDSWLETYIQQHLGPSAPNLKMTLACGYQPTFGYGTRVAEAIGGLLGTASDGVVPLNSCKGAGPTGNVFTGLAPYPLTYDLSHIELACNNQVIHDVGQLVQGLQPATQNGVCGSSNGGSFTTAPTTNLCSQGTASSVSGSGPWAWSCAGANGGTTASCSAQLLSCGASNGGSFTTAPTAGLCTNGTPGAVTGGNGSPWVWNCTGSNGTTTSCMAISAPSTYTISITIAGTGSGTVSCSGANCSQPIASGTKVTLTESPNSGSTFSGWGGACSGLGTTCKLTVTQDEIVTANFTTTVNGTCGASNGEILPTKPTSGLCNAGTASAVSGAGPWTWSCAGANGGTTASCSAQLLSCGASNGGSFTTAPTAGLCTNGTPGAVTGGNGSPWVWNCTGSNGTTTSCTASFVPTSGTGISGTWVGTYAFPTNYLLNVTDCNFKNITESGTVTMIISSQLGSLPYVFNLTGTVSMSGLKVESTEVPSGADCQWFPYSMSSASIGSLSMWTSVTNQVLIFVNNNVPRMEPPYYINYDPVESFTFNGTYANGTITGTLGILGSSGTFSVTKQ
jgi:pimeloyl-ACP methyl ester carboxylesterase